MTTEETEKLIRSLDSRCWRERRRSVIALGRTGDARAAAPLCRALQESTLRGVAAQALLQVGEAAVPALCLALESANTAARCRAAELLGQIGDARAISSLMALKNSDDPGLRRRAAAALSEIGGRHRVVELSALLQHPDAGVRRRAALLLTSLRHPSARPVLETLLQQADWEIGRCAAAALGEIGDLGTFLILCQVVPHGPAEAAWALAEIAERRDVPAAELQTALSALEQRVQTPFPAFDGGFGLDISRTALFRVNARAVRMGSLPIPASPPVRVANLPRTALPPAASAASLPAPAPPPFSG